MKNRILHLIPLWLVLITGLLAACQPTVPTVPPGTSNNQQAAEQTQVVARAQATPTRKPTVTPRPPTPTAQPLRPTLTPSITATDVPPTVTQTLKPEDLAIISGDAPCEQAAFVLDVNYPDNTYIQPDTEFTKTWRIKNIGTCTWTTDWAVVYDYGAPFEAPALQPLAGSVAPGQLVDISLKMKTPRQPGVYKGYWKLRSPSGLVFGTGKANKPFYVDLIVTHGSIYRYDFTGFNCNAVWTVDGKIVTCHTNDDIPGGYTRIIAFPVLEDGSEDNEPGLLTVPPTGNGGEINGTFSEFTVRKGDHFLAIIGCAYEFTRCDVRFQLDYRIGDGPILNYAHWDQVYDKKVEKIDIELKELVGQTVHFVLTVIAKNDSSDNHAFWLMPRIEKGAVAPADTPMPTFTPTVTPNP